MPVTESGLALVLTPPYRVPDVCVKCGARSGTRRLRVPLTTTPAYASVVPLVSFFVRRTVHIQAPFCRTCHARWLTSLLLTALGVVPSIAGLALLFMASNGDTRKAIGGAMLLVLGFIHVRFTRFRLRDRALWATSIEAKSVTVMGIHPSAKKALLEAAEFDR